MQRSRIPVSAGVSRPAESYPGDRGALLAQKMVFPAARVEGSRSSHVLGFRPAAVIAWWSQQARHGTERGNRGGIGYWASNASLSVAWTSGDAEPSARVRTIADTAAIVGLDAEGESVGMRAHVETFDGDGVTLRWEAPPTEDWIIHLLGLGGAAIENVRVAWATAEASESHVVLDLADMRPDLLLTVPALNDVGIPSDDLLIGIGAASETGQVAASYFYPHHARPGHVTGVQRSDAVVADARSLRDPVTYGVLRRQRTAGSSILWLSTTGRSPRVGYLAIDGIRAKVGTTSSPTAPGRRRTVVGFHSAALLLFSGGLPRSAGAAQNGRLCVGGTAAGSSGCTCWDDCDVESFETMSHVRSFDDRALVVADTQSNDTHAQVTVASIDEDGFTLAWSECDEKARELAYIALGARGRKTGILGNIRSRLVSRSYRS